MATAVIPAGTRAPLGGIFREGSRRRKRKWHVEGPVEAPVSKCRRFWKLLISAIHKAEELRPPLLGRYWGAQRGAGSRGSRPEPERPAENRRRLPPGEPSASRRCPGEAGAPSDRKAGGPRGSRAQRPEDADPDPDPDPDSGRRRTTRQACLWWGWTWAPRAATSRWPGPGASRPSPTNSATGAPRKWALRGAGRGRDPGAGCGARGCWGRAGPESGRRERGVAGDAVRGGRGLGARPAGRLPTAWFWCRNR